MKERLSLFLLLLSFALYLSTVAPTVYWADGGELITAAYLLDLAHPPSFPLYLLLGKLMTLIPLGNIAFKVNLISVIFGALTIMMLYKISHKISSLQFLSQTATLSAFFCALLFAVTPAFWLQSVRSEVYTLNLFLTMFMVWLLLQEIRYKTIFLLALLIGLSLGNHSLLLLFALPAMILFFASQHRLAFARPTILALTLFFVLAGLSVYLYLPLRSTRGLILDWPNPDSFTTVVEMFTRKKSLHKFFTYSTLIERVRVYIYLLLEQFTLLWTGSVIWQLILNYYWIGVIGAWKLFKEEKRLGFFTSLLFGGSLFIGVVSVSFSTQNPDILGYTSLSYLIYALWIGIGLGTLIEGLRWLSKNVRLSQRVAFFAPLPSLAIAALLISPVAPLFSHWPNADKHDHYLAHQYGVDLLNVMNEDAILFARTDDTIFVLWYLLYCEKNREDVRLLNENNLWKKAYLERKRTFYSDLFWPEDSVVISFVDQERPTDQGKDERVPQWGKSVIEYVVHRNREQHQIYWEWESYSSLINKQLTPQGLLFEMTGDHLKTSQAGRHEEILDHLYQRLLSEKKFRNDMNAAKAYSLAFFYLGSFYLTREIYEKAAVAYERSVALSPNLPQAQNALGYSYLRLGLLEKAEKEFLDILKIYGFYEDAALNLGVSYARRGEYQKARQQWEEVLKQNPQSHHARENLKKLGNLGV